MSHDLDAQLAAWKTDALDQILHKVNKVDALVDSVRRLESVTEKMADAVTKLAVVENQQANDRAEVAALRVENNTLRERVAELERAETLNARVRVAVFALSGIVGSAVVYAILARIGLGK